MMWFNHLGRGALAASLLVVLALVAPATHAADSWETTFEPSALARLSIPGRARVSLVAAGEASPELDAARAALTAGMRASGAWTLIDGDLVRDIDDDLRDVDILELERDARHVEAVWILRLLPPIPGAPRTASVAIYAPLGAVLKSFHGVEGKPLHVMQVEPDLGAEYLRQRISPVAGDAIATSEDAETFARGAGFAKDGAQLEEPRDLYIAMGRYDLVEAYDASDHDKRLVTIISGGAMFLGAILFMQDVFDDGGIPSLEIGALGISGIVVGGLGSVGLVVGLVLDPDPLDWQGKVDAATRYNADLKQRLGAPDKSALERGARGRELGLRFRGRF